MNRVMLSRAIGCADRGWRVRSLYTMNGTKLRGPGLTISSDLLHGFCKDSGYVISPRSLHKFGVSHYPSAASGFESQPATSTCSSADPAQLKVKEIKAPSLSEDLLPERLRAWVIDISERIQVPPEYVFAPALVSFSSIVGRKIGIHPKQYDDWLVMPNLWGAIVGNSSYHKSAAIAEAMHPIDRLSERSRIGNESNKHLMNASKLVADVQLEILMDSIKSAAKENYYERIDQLKEQLAVLKKECEEASFPERRYKTNDASVEKIARLLNDNPNGLLLLRDDLNSWLQTLSKTEREGEREFYLASWNGYGSYTTDSIGPEALHRPAVCLSLFGGIEPDKLRAYVKKTIQCSAENDGLLQRFQMLIYPELSSTWTNVDRSPDLIARENVYNIFDTVDRAVCHDTEHIRRVRFSDSAQLAFNLWREQLENRVRGNELGCSAFESHLANYRSLMPSLALLFWILEEPNNIRGNGVVSLSATILAIRWCEFLEQHLSKVYRIDRNIKNLAIDVVNSKHVTNIQNFVRRV